MKVGPPAPPTSLPVRIATWFARSSNPAALSIHSAVAPAPSAAPAATAASNRCRPPDGHDTASLRGRPPTTSPPPRPGLAASSHSITSTMAAIPIQDCSAASAANPATARGRANRCGRLVAQCCASRSCSLRSRAARATASPS